VEESLKEDYYPALAKLFGIPVENVQSIFEKTVEEILEGEPEREDIAG